MKRTILMYSHDIYGLGHISRMRAIADGLADNGYEVHILTLIPIKYHPDPERDGIALHICADSAHLGRRALDLASVIHPSALLVDLCPGGKDGCLLPTLAWMEEHTPAVPRFLIMRDIMDPDSSAPLDWQDENITERYYHKIVVCGNREIFDITKEMPMPEALVQRTIFAGYLPRPTLKKRGWMREAFQVPTGMKIILFTMGGGDHGGSLMLECVRAVREHLRHWAFPVFVTGPFIRYGIMENLDYESRSFLHKIYPFVPYLTDMVADADLMVSRAGYNTVNEAMFHRTKTLLIPMGIRRTEQIVRAERLGDMFRVLNDQDAFSEAIGKEVHVLNSESAERTWRMGHVDFSCVDRIYDELQIVAP